MVLSKTKMNDFSSSESEETASAKQLAVDASARNNEKKSVVTDFMYLLLVRC